MLTSSLGGILAVRTPGKSSARHGFFEDAVVGVSAVLATGAACIPGSPRAARPAPTSRARCAGARARSASSPRGAADPRPPEARLVAAYLVPSIDAAVNAVYLALREEAAPSGLRIYDADEAALHYAGVDLPAGQALLCAGTAGPPI